MILVQIQSKKKKRERERENIKMVGFKLHSRENF